MALDQSALSTLLDSLRAGGDMDFMREAMQLVLQALIDLEADAHIGAGRYERTDSRTTHRNGSRARLLSTKAGDVELAVCGAHMRGMALNGQLLELGARFVRATVTAPAYRLYAVPGGQRPGLVRAPGGRAISVEIWRLPAASLGALMTRVAAPLAIGTVELADGSTPHGFLCEPHAVTDAPDISSHGSWQAYLTTQEASFCDRRPIL